MDTNKIIREVLVSIVRHGLSIVAAFLISKGLVAPEMMSNDNLLTLAGGIVAALISLGAIVYKKLKNRYMLDAARDAKPETKPQTIENTALRAMKAELPLPSALIK